VYVGAYEKVRKPAHVLTLSVEFTTQNNRKTAHIAMHGENSNDYENFHRRQKDVRHIRQFPSELDVIHTAMFNHLHLEAENRAKIGLRCYVGLSRLSYLFRVVGTRRRWAFNDSE
jgi:hypothetical protein